MRLPPGKGNRKGKQVAARCLVATLLVVTLLPSSLPSTAFAEAPADARAITLDASSAVFAALRAYLRNRRIPSRLSSENAQPNDLRLNDLHLADLHLGDLREEDLRIEDLVLLSPPPAHAELQVTSSRWDQLQQEFQFYLRCSDPHACRPFLAMIGPHKGRVLAALRTPAPRGAQTFQRPSLQSTGIQETLPHPSWLHPSLPQEVFIIAAGEQVRLVMTGPNMRIQFPAICLEPGARGQQVRARGIGDAKLFRARVMGPGWLAAEFP